MSVLLQPTLCAKPEMPICLFNALDVLPFPIEIIPGSEEARLIYLGLPIPNPKRILCW